MANELKRDRQILHCNEDTKSMNEESEAYLEMIRKPKP